MADNWTTHFDGTVAGRPVVVKTYVDGGYRVSTTQGADEDGSISVDDTSITFMPPFPKGRKIDIDAKSILEVREQLVNEGFSDDEAGEIILHFPA